MKVFIPALGTQLRLTQMWAFLLHAEHRNRTMWQKAGGTESTSRGVNLTTMPMFLPPGTVLTVDRVYIRHGQKAFNSVTFRILKGSTPLEPQLGGCRFWAKLGDVNEVECEVISHAT